jgi:uncharacterized membrane protein
MEIHRREQLRFRPGLIAGHWPKAVRVASVGLGALVVARSVRSRSRASIALAGAGAALIARAVLNRSLSQLFGDVVMPAERLSRRLAVGAPVDDVYDFWSDPGNFPLFMSFVREVVREPDGSLRWKLRGASGLEWVTSALELLPDQRVSWKSLPGALIAMECEAKMEPLDAVSTDLRVALTFAPPGGALGAFLLRRLRFDPRDRIDGDLATMRTLVESTHSARIERSS